MDNDSTVFVGLDVHKDSITVARVGSAATDPVVDVATIGTQQYAIDRLIARLSGHGPLQFVYEAGPCGFWLHRYLTGKGQRCLVAAPSLVPRRPGDRIKTDRRDARNLVLGLRAGTLTAVHIPGPEQQAFRERCLAAGVRHYWGGVVEAEDALIDLGLATRLSSGALQIGRAA